MAKIILVLLTLIIISAVVWFVMDYLKTERQYQTCLESCGLISGMSSDELYQGIMSPFVKACELECKEKYGK